MPVKPWNESLRDPRHQAVEGNAIEVVVVRKTTRPELHIHAELVNLSRQGMQIRIGQPLTKGETVATRFLRWEAKPYFEQQATVLWVRTDGGQWLVGCQFETEIEWEAMGELFANNVLEI